MNDSNGEMRIATIGGTFDTLHRGHKEYIRMAFNFADRVLLYLATDEYTTGKKDYGVKPYAFRLKSVQQFIEQIGCEARCEIRRLNKLAELEADLLREKIFMAIISPEYYNFFMQISNARQQSDMDAFLILIKPRTRDGKNKDISSREIRNLRFDLRP